jgi:hypothetical protein
VAAPKTIGYIDADVVLASDDIARRVEPRESWFDASVKRQAMMMPGLSSTTSLISAFGRSE